MTKQVERVVVVGRDAAAWMSALAIQRALGATGLKVIVLELPSLLLPTDAFAAVPSLRALHKLLGIDETLLLSACAAVPMVAQRFSNWSRSTAPYFQCYDTPAVDGIRDIDFLQYWLKARSEGLRVGLDDFQLGAAAAKQGRVPSAEAEGALSATAGYHLDARRYAGLLKHVALKAGVEHRTGKSVEVERAAERILSVQFAGESLQGDLYIDASGTEATLIGETPGASFESWSRWLPCDRLLSASAPPLRPLPAFSQISAFRAGWIGLYPLQGRTAVTSAFSSTYSDAEMLGNLAVLAGVPIEGDAVISPFVPGCRRRPWIGNCVAVGEAAASLEPLDAVQLHMAHVGISHLVALFPVDAGRMPEAESYNASLAAYADNLRDFQIAHYQLNRRYDEPFWDEARQTAPPSTLATKLQLFEGRGQVALYDDESFQEQNWASLLIGHGLLPVSYDPRIDAVPREEHMAQMQQRLKTVAAEVNAMPSIAAFLAGNAPAPG